MQEHATTRVSVVIPTIGRSELARALASARAQIGSVEVETIVVVDQPESHAISGPALDLADRVIYTGTRAGGSAARNLGVQAATGEFVAFLDDDDEWMPEKLRVQLEVAASMPNPQRVIVGSRHIHRDAGNGRRSGPLPNRVKPPEESVANYLFRRRRPSGGRASMYTSTLLCSRDLAVAVTWNRLPRHQDWDWLIRAERAGAQIVQSPEPLVLVQTGSAVSVSASTDWASSLAWAAATLDRDPQVLVDFLTAQTLRYAMAARSWTGILAVLSRVVRERRVPGIGPIVIGLGGLMPRSAIEAILIRFR